jgi:hypothetical protein
MMARLGPSLTRDPPLLFFTFGLGLDSISAVAVATLCEFLFMCAYSSPIKNSSSLSKIDNQMFRIYKWGEDSPERGRQVSLLEDLTRMKTIRSTVFAVPEALRSSALMDISALRGVSSKVHRLTVDGQTQSVFSLGTWLQVCSSCSSTRWTAPIYSEDSIASVGPLL